MIIIHVFLGSGHPSFFDFLDENFEGCGKCPACLARKAKKEEEAAPAANPEGEKSEEPTK